MRTVLGGIHIIMLLVTVSCEYKVQLSKRSTLYLPSSYTTNGSAVFEFENSCVEQFAYDDVNRVVFTVGSTILHAIDVSDPDNMAVVSYLEYPGMEFTDVEFCGGHIFTVLDNRTDRANGQVIIFSMTGSSITELMQIPVGAVPDMVKSSSDCSKLVVAVEGEAYQFPPNQVTDPPGLVVIITFPNGVNADYNKVSLNFTYYDDKVDELSESGVRHVYQENNNPFSNDVEPEYIAFNHDDTIAYVVLQENNAVATVDLIRQTITGIHGLGFKDWSKSSLDPSDRDGGAMMNPYSVLGMYIPDAIIHFTFEANNYILMANEGGSKNYFFGDYSWSEEERLGRVNSSILPTLDPITASQVERDSLLGRIKVSVSPAGMDSNGRLKALYTFGGRGFSVRHANNMSLVYDSGDTISKLIFEHKRDLFNSEVGDKNNRPFEEYDQRSDNKGAETESLAVGVVDGVPLLFVANERPGTILVYSVHSSISAPVFQDIYDGIPDKRGKSWAQMYEERTLSEIDPEDMHFIPASKSPTKKPVLFVAGSISGTFSIINVDIFQKGSLDSMASHINTGTGMLILTALVTIISL